MGDPAPPESSLSFQIPVPWSLHPHLNLYPPVHAPGSHVGQQPPGTRLAVPTYMERMGATLSRDAMRMPVSQMRAVSNSAQVGSPLAFPWPKTCRRQPRGISSTPGHVKPRQQELPSWSTLEKLHRARARQAPACVPRPPLAPSRPVLPDTSQSPETCPPLALTPTATSASMAQSGRALSWPSAPPHSPRAQRAFQKPIGYCWSHTKFSGKLPAVTFSDVQGTVPTPPMDTCCQAGSWDLAWEGRVQARAGNSSKGRS